MGWDLPHLGTLVSKAGESLPPWALWRDGRVGGWESDPSFVKAEKDNSPPRHLEGYILRQTDLRKDYRGS